MSGCCGNTAASTMNAEQELVSLREQNKQLKALVHNALSRKIKFQDLPKELQEDRSLIISALKDDKSLWHDLEQKWKDDAEIACFIFQPRDGSTILKLDSRPVHWIDLPYHLKFNKEVLLLAIRKDKRLSWENIPDDLKSDVDIITEAFLKNLLKFEQVPEDLQRTHREIALYAVQNGWLNAADCSCFDHEYFVDAIEIGAMEWSALPQKLRSNAEFAHSISSFDPKPYPGEPCFWYETGNLPADILFHVREIRHDRKFWLKFAGSMNPEGNLKELLETYAPAGFFSDQELMLRMLARFPKVFPIIQGSLKRDPSFMGEALSLNASILLYLSHDEQLLHRGLVIEALPRLPHVSGHDDSYNMLSDFPQMVHHTLWHDKEFAMAWVKAGRGVPGKIGGLATTLVEIWRNERQLFVANAIHCRREDRALCFRSHASDPDFMRDVMDCRPSLFKLSKEPARSNPAIMTIAFADCPKTAHAEMQELHFSGRNSDIQNYLDHLQKELAPFKTFSKFVLGNMLSTQSVEATGTNLTLLNQGLETSTEFKKQLAAFVGIPTGKKLKRLHQAETNVLKAIAPFADHFTLE